MWPLGAGEEGERDLPLLESGSGRGTMKVAATVADEERVGASAIADASLSTPLAQLRNEAAFEPVVAVDR